MTCYARQVATPSPAAIAVHDDRDVRGHAGGIKRIRENPILTPGLEDLEQIFD
jgi:hypothetical protein